MGDSLLQPPLATDARFQRFYHLLDRQQQLDLTPVLIYLIDLTEPSALNSLADQFSLIGDGWELAESDDVRRDLIKAAIELHRYKGTPWSIREVIRRFGFGEVDLIEGVGDVNYDGKSTYNGNYVHGNPKDWAVYRVILKQVITNDQAAALRLALDAFAPARCRLAGLDYQSVPVRYNQTATYNGHYNHGSS